MPGQRLLKCLDEFMTADMSHLRDPLWLTERLLEVGLFHDPRGIYGKEYNHLVYSIPGPGIYQVPAEMAELLVSLSYYPIERVLDIGTLNGWTISLMTAYLQRFNPNITVDTCDTVWLEGGHSREHLYEVFREVCNMLPVTYRGGCTSDAFRNREFDLCMIDGNHSYSWVMRDYHNAGQTSGVTVLHDINDQGALDVETAWRELKQRASGAAYEIIRHPDREKWCGYGVLLSRRMISRRENEEVDAAMKPSDSGGEPPEGTR